MRGVTAHMIVRNEDHWVWFAIKSVLPYVDALSIVDTGSTDMTQKCIEAIHSPKITFKKIECTTASEVTAIRQKQLRETKTDWLWIVDGDEIYPKACALEVVNAIKKEAFNIIVVRRYDLLGDVYHRQKETVGQYTMYGEKGHLLVRLLNKTKLKELHISGDYPLEGYYTGERSIEDLDKSEVYITQNYLYHAMYLTRSSSGSNLTQILNRSKYKVETGLKITTIPPEVFALKRPAFVPDPYRHRSLMYEASAAFMTPIKNLKRELT